MPELAEVDYYRRQWNSGLGALVEAVKLHPAKRIFRGSDPAALKKVLPGSILLRSEAHGKQMLFQFSNSIWLGLHLGMTGELRTEKPGFRPGKHDHLVLYQHNRALVFSDPRQFGRVRFHIGSGTPDWWAGLPVPLLSRQFTLELMKGILSRHRKLSLKAALLSQGGFPGLGNWMADEILWRARLHPSMHAVQLGSEQLKKLWRIVRFVCHGAMKSVSTSY